MLLQVEKILDNEGNEVDIGASIVLEYLDREPIIHGIVNNKLKLIDKLKNIGKNNSLIYKNVALKTFDSYGKEYIIEAFSIKICEERVHVYIKYIQTYILVNSEASNVGKEFIAYIDNSNNLNLQNNGVYSIDINNIKFEIENSSLVQLRKNIKISTTKNINNTYELIKEIKDILYVFFNHDLVKLYTNNIEITLIPYNKDNTNDTSRGFSTSRDTLDIEHIERLILKGITYINVDTNILNEVAEVYLLIRNCEYIEYTLIKMYALIDKVTRHVKPKYNYSAVKMYKDGKIGFLIHTKGQICSILSRIIETSDNIYNNNKCLLNNIDFAFLTKHRNSIAHLKDDNYLSKVEIERLLKEMQGILFFHIFNTSNNTSNGIDMVDSIRLGIDNYNYNYLNDRIYFNESFGLTLNSNGNVVVTNIIIHESTKYVLEVDVNGHNIPIGVPVKLQGHLDRDVLTKRLILVVDNY